MVSTTRQTQTAVLRKLPKKTHKHFTLTNNYKIQTYRSGWSKT